MKATEAAKFLGVTRGTIGYHLAKGTLAATKVAGHGGPSSFEWEIDEKDLLAFQARRERAAAEQAAAKRTNGNGNRAASIAAFPSTDHHVGPSYKHRNKADGYDDFITCEDWPHCWASCGQCKPPQQKRQAARRVVEPLQPSAAFTADLVRRMRPSGGYGANEREWEE